MPIVLGLLIDSQLDLDSEPELARIDEISCPSIVISEVSSLKLVNKVLAGAIGISKGVKP